MWVPVPPSSPPVYHTEIHVMINEVPPKPKKGEPQGYQTDHGPLWCAVAKTEWGRIPGKSDGSMCWYPYGGQEHMTDDFKLVKHSNQAPPHSEHMFDPHGYQTDGAGHVWCAVARTPWGRIPGKAQGDTCWYSYGDQEHTTGDFYYVAARRCGAGPRGDAVRGARPATPRAPAALPSRRRP